MPGTLPLSRFSKRGDALCAFLGLSVGDKSSSPANWPCHQCCRGDTAAIELTTFCHQCRKAVPHSLTQPYPRCEPVGNRPATPWFAKRPVFRGAFEVQCTRRHGGKGGNSPPCVKLPNNLVRSVARATLGTWSRWPPAPWCLRCWKPFVASRLCLPVVPALLLSSFRLSRRISPACRSARIPSALRARSVLAALRSACGLWACPCSAPAGLPMRQGDPLRQVQHNEREG